MTSKTHLKKIEGLMMKGLAYYRYTALLVLVALFFLQIAGPVTEWWQQARVPLYYEDTVEEVSRDHGVDPFLVAAVIRAESGFRPRAVSSRGAQGLMQVMPATGAWVARNMGRPPLQAGELFDPEVNIAIGTWYLAHLQRQFGPDPVPVLAAYNAGQGNVRRWMEQGQGQSQATLEMEDIPFPETKDYVHKVLEYRDTYARLYQNEWPLSGRALAGDRW